MDSKTESIYLNEINTMLGFTTINMCPKLWAASGLEYGALIAADRAGLGALPGKNEKSL